MRYLQARCRHWPCTIFTTRITNLSSPISPFTVGPWPMGLVVSCMASIPCKKSLFSDIENSGDFSISKIYFPISKIHLPISEIYFRLSEIPLIFRYRKMNFQNWKLFSDIGNSFLDIGNSFFRYRKFIYGFRISENSGDLHGMLTIELEPLQLLYRSNVWHCCMIGWINTHLERLEP